MHKDLHAGVGWEVNMLTAHNESCTLKQMAEQAKHNAPPFPKEAGLLSRVPPGSEGCLPLRPQGTSMSICPCRLLQKLSNKPKWCLHLAARVVRPDGEPLPDNNCPCQVHAYPCSND